MLREAAFAGWELHVRITVHAPAEDVLARINPAVGVVEVVYIGMLGLDFTVAQPPELAVHIAKLATRHQKAVS